MLQKIAIYGVIGAASTGFTLGSAPAQAGTLPIVPDGTPLATYADRLLGARPLDATNVPALVFRAIPLGVPIKAS